MLEVREIYDQITNVEKFFEAFAEGRNNRISQMRNEIVNMLDRLRLFILEKMVKEEQYKQILRSLEAENQIFEFRGYNEVYVNAVGLPVTDFKNEYHYYNEFQSNATLD